MSLFDLFRPVQRVEASPAQAPAQAPAKQEPLTPQNSSADPASIAKTMTPEPALPLDDFKSMWETPTNATPQTDPWAAPLVNYDQAVMSAQVKNMNFTAGLDPAMAEKALQGDSAALMNLLNGAAQSAFEKSLQLSAATTNAAGNTLASRVKEYVPNAYREQQVKESPVDNPALEHPAFAPMVQATRTQIARQNPGMSAAEVSRRTNDYFAKAFQSYNSGTPQGQQAQSAPSVNPANDFENW